MNSKLRSDNTSGVKGISWNKEKQKYEVYINVNKKRIRLGRYKQLSYAVAARIWAEEKYFGEFRNKDLINENRKKYS